MSLVAAEIDQMIERASVHVSNTSQRKSRKKPLQSPRQLLENALTIYTTDVSKLETSLAKDRTTVLTYLQNALKHSPNFKNVSNFCQAHFGCYKEGNRFCWGVPAEVYCSSLPSYRLKTACAIDDILYSPSALRSLSYVMWTIEDEHKLKKHDTHTVHIHGEWADLLWSWSVLYLLPLRLEVNMRAYTDVDSVSMAFDNIIRVLKVRANLMELDGLLLLPWSQTV